MPPGSTTSVNCSRCGWGSDVRRAESIPRSGSAAVAIAARIGRASFQQRAAGRTDAYAAEDPNRRLEFFKENRPGKIEALRIADLGGGLQIGEFLEGFDAFRDHGHAKRLAQRFDRPQNALAARALMDVGDEGAVDLDLIGGDVGQRRQRRVADAEIVDRDPDPKLAPDRAGLL